MQRFCISVLLICMYTTMSFAIDCADGYAPDASDTCVTVCQPGNYVTVPGGQCTPIPYGHEYYSSLHTVVYGQTSGSDDVKPCPMPAPGTDYKNVGIPASVKHDSVHACIAWGRLKRWTYSPGGKVYTTHGVVSQPCYYTSGDDGNAIYDVGGQWGCVGGSSIISCDAGFYSPIEYTGDEGQLHPCNPVGYRYYSPDGDVNRYPCPERTVTCGYGDCADDISDCVPYMWFKTDTGISVVLSSNKLTDPALVADIPDMGRFYGRLVPGNREGFVNIGGYTLMNPLEEFEVIDTRAYQIISIP